MMGLAGHTVGVIGAGNMGGAIVAGFARSVRRRARTLLRHGRKNPRRSRQDFGADVSRSIGELAARATSSSSP